ncbi:hypothetical protein JANAI62_33350 [Jannaschia pagri]|uniref:Uncharacterized protein n=1 Tax=Jannaschia pagri TaxID=2829797 RepID=A0ABQ4NQM4_9RHOB|nr:hypothetical protein JANAI61_33350 [Jannaschia sp. AI_61]GIT96712.1 hypothetical protein JANAI62_33350 [Jannaschia sp. AI_62]
MGERRALLDRAPERCAPSTVAEADPTGHVHVPERSNGSGHAILAEQMIMQCRARETRRIAERGQRQTLDRLETGAPGREAPGRGWRVVDVCDDEGRHGAALPLWAAAANVSRRGAPADLAPGRPLP